MREGVMELDYSDYVLVKPYLRRKPHVYSKVFTTPFQYIGESIYKTDADIDQEKYIWLWKMIGRLSLVIIFIIATGILYQIIRP